jgi:hypothetical protein
MTSAHRWLDADAGPVVRPYAVTGGRTVPASDRFDLVALVGAAVPVDDVTEPLSPEHTAILRLCEWPKSVAEVSALLDLPIGIVRVLLSDLLERELVIVREAGPVDEPSQGVLDKVITGLRAL